MKRFIAGSISALLLAAGGLFWWDGRQSSDQTSIAAAPQSAASPVPELPPEPDSNAMDDGPPLPPTASARTREQKRFDRYDRDRDNLITRNELLGSRVKDFRKLDKDGNNLLSFEEWAVRTEDRFDTADANHDGRLTRAEFASTAPKRAARPKCKC